MEVQTKAAPDFKLKTSGSQLKIQESIVENANEVLFHYPTYNIQTPNLRSQYLKHNLNNTLFVSPDLDETALVSYEEGGRALKRLDDSQKSSLRNYGQFGVPSVLFPGNDHVWRVSEIFQKGKQKTRATFYVWIANAYNLVVIQSKHRILGKGKFCLHRSYRSIKAGLWKLADALVGLPYIRKSLNVVGLPSWDAELAQYIAPRDYSKVAEIIAVVEKYYEANSERNDSKYPKLPSSASIFDIELAMQNLGPNDSDFPWFIFNQKMWKQIQDITEDLLLEMDKIEHLFTIDMKYDLVLKHSGSRSNLNDVITGAGDGDDRSTTSSFVADKVEPSALQKVVNEKIREAYVEKFLQLIANSESLQAIDKRLPELLVNNFNCNDRLDCHEAEKQSEIEEIMSKYEGELKKTNPVKGRTKHWRRPMARNHRQQLQDEMKKEMEEMRNERLEPWVRPLYDIAATFEAKLEELKAKCDVIKEPLFEIKHKIMIWNPKNYKIERRGNLFYLRGEEVPWTRVPTLFAETEATSSTFTRTAHAQFTYTCAKAKYHNVSSGWFWRWRDMFQFGRCLFWNSLYVFCLVIPFVSQVSFKAIVYPNKFSMGYKMGVSDGLLYAGKKVHSMISRIHSLHRNISKSRAKFEATPDRGLLGKNITRPFNLFWNYICKGLVGTTMFILFYPFVNTLLSTLSILVGITTPLWLPFAMIVYYLIQILIADFKRPGYSEGFRFFYLFHIFIYKFFILGFCQPVSCVFLTFVGYPLTALVLCVLGSLQICIRSSYDFVIYHLFLKRIARVPATNSFAAKKIAGPGMASDFFLQMDPEHALVPVFYWVDILILDTWRQLHKRQIGEPKQIYNNFFDQLFEPFSAIVSGGGGNGQKRHQFYSQLLKEESEHTDRLNKVYGSAINNLHIHIPNKNLIRLRAQDLDKLIMMTTQYLSNVITESLFPFLDDKKSLNEFWKSREIKKDDWVSLARHVLTEVYSDPFMVPLEETDVNCAFKLKVEELTLSSYLEGVISTEIADPLEAHSVTFKRLSNNIHVTRPRQSIENIDKLRRHSHLFNYSNICAQHLAEKYPLLANKSDRLVAHIWKELGASGVDLEYAAAKQKRIAEQEIPGLRGDTASSTVPIQMESVTET